MDTRDGYAYEVWSCFWVVVRLEGVRNNQLQPSQPQKLNSAVKSV